MKFFRIIKGRFSEDKKKLSILTQILNCAVHKTASLNIYIVHCTECCTLFFTIGCNIYCNFGYIVHSTVPCIFHSNIRCIVHFNVHCIAHSTVGCIVHSNVHSIVHYNVGFIVYSTVGFTVHSTVVCISGERDWFLAIMIKIETFKIPVLILRLILRLLECQF